ncbi:MAG TPA: cytochrome c [Steroidobacteraceae bacterium]|jgi:mono/diheme cytochrome c family protein|nr:cytochrome c [Steroidobacteraceae bacterium]
MSAMRHTILALLLGAAAHAGDPPAAAANPAVPAAPAAKVDTRSPGERLYARHCLPCHQSDGYGVPDMQPAITGGQWVKGDPKALAMFVMTGGFGSAERKDSANSNVMPEFRQLPDADLAEILTFIRAKFGGGGSPVSAADVTAARADLPK